MTLLPPTPIATVLAALAASFGLLAGAQAAGPKRLELPIELVAASSEYDVRNNVVVLREVIITQGEVQVRATTATATGLDFDNSQWVLKGQVRIRVQGGSLSSNEARVNFVDNRIASASIAGSPASFEQKLENGDTARGHAEDIEYDFDGATVRLSRDAYLTDGRNDISGETLVYSIRDERVLANADEQGDERVHITINPRAVEEARKQREQNAPPKPPADETP